MVKTRDVQPRTWRAAAPAEQTAWPTMIAREAADKKKQAV